MVAARKKWKHWTSNFLYLKNELMLQSKHKVYIGICRGHGRGILLLSKSEA